MAAIIGADEKRDREVREPGYSKTLGDGFINSLKPGDTVIIRPHERYLFRNESESNAIILVASSI